MSQVEFNYKGMVTVIQCKENEKMNEIFNRLSSKIKVDINSLFFLYKGEIVKDGLTFEEIISSEDKIRNKMTILVNSTDDQNLNEKDLAKSKTIICPKCGEISKINIYNYKISLYDCINKHKTDNIFLDQYEKSQFTDESTIICDNCKVANKSTTYENNFYRCNTCKNNLCPLCKSNHDKSHNIINYEDKYYICENDNEYYTSYCKTCKKNICMICEEEHNDHDIVSFGKMITKKNNLKLKMNELRIAIDKFNNNVKEIIDILNKMIQNMEQYYKININIMNNYDMKNKNYETFYNIKEIMNYNNNFLNKIDAINNDPNIRNKFNSILDIYENMTTEDYHQIKIIYKINKNDEFIKIFGTDFVNNNKNNCKIIYEDKEYDLEEKFDLKNVDKNKDILEIQLKGIMNVTTMYTLFYGCTSLISVPDISNWNTKNVNNMCAIFRDCISLESLPDISKWNTNNVINMNSMFSNCKSLKSLPDISKWNTSKVVKFGCMFKDCSELSSLPDISKWDISSAINIGGMFYNCSQLSSLPDISKWNTFNTNTLSGLFFNCSSLLSLPDISNWSTINAFDISTIFSKCSSLKTIPDISKWNLRACTNIKAMFLMCSSLLSLPDISIWNTSQIHDMSYLFCGCTSLESLPDISKWDTQNVNKMEYMFSCCTNLSNLPDISKWNINNVTNMEYMFSKCLSLKCFNCFKNINQNVNITNMFEGCDLNK